MRKKAIKHAVIIYTLLLGVLALATSLNFVIAQSGQVPTAYIPPINYTALIFQLIAVLFITLICSLCFISKENGKYTIAVPTNQLAVICTAIAITYTFSIFVHQLITPLFMPVFLTAFLLAPLSKRRNVFFANLFSNILILVVITIGQVYQYSSIPHAPAIMFLIGILAGSLAAFVLTYENRRFQFIIKGIIICLISIGLTVAISSIVFTQVSYATMEYRFVTAAPRFLDEMARSALVFSSLAFFTQLILGILLAPLFEKAFNLLTNSRLIDLTDHNFPLMKRLMTEIPGTFNHSLTVANFAQMCAIAIGENPYLARAAAYYHDIGKLENPHFFKENQLDETNPHDSILPEVSAEVIRNHAEFGIELCKQYWIPKEIYSVAIEHHGTMPITVFLAKAQSMTDGKVDVAEYSYKGPIPSTKIAAIIMICDAAEAAIRAVEDDEDSKRQEVLDKLIQDRIKAGQFDACDITLKELYTIKDTILSAFSGVYHKRIKYPDGK